MTEYEAIEAFMAETIDKGTDSDWVRAAELYTRYRRWRKDKENKDILDQEYSSSHIFGRQMRLRGIQKTRFAKGYYYQGIAWREPL